jgi:hypothetical protein
MTQSFRQQVVGIRPATVQACTFALRNPAALVLPVLATILLLLPAPAAAQEDQPRSRDCLQDKKLDVENPGGDLIVFRSLRRKDSLTEADKRTIDRCVKYYVYTFSWPEQRKELNQKRRALLSDVNTGSHSQAFRREVAQRLLQYLPDLFDNHCIVRYNAARLLAEFEDDTYFERGVGLLVSELNKAGQDEAFQLATCQAVERLATKGFSLLRSRDNAINAVVELLNSKENLHPWTQLAAVNAIGAIAARADGRLSVNERELQPALQELVEILHHADAHPRCRARAAEAIGRIDTSGMRSKINFSLVAHETVALAASLGTQYAKNFDQLQVTEDAEEWKFYFALLVKCFRGDLRETGLLRMAASEPDQLAVVQQAEKQVVALTQAVFDPFATPEDISERVADLQGWVDQNPLSDRRLTPGLPEVAAATPVGE